MFTLYRDGVVLFGNNEDWTKPGVIWFERGGEGKYGRVNVGFDGRFAQGSMNEKGLAFDSSALNPAPWEPDPAKETPKNLLEKIMNECKDVGEAADYFKRYNCTHLAEAQFMFADANGNAITVSWLPESGLHVAPMPGEFSVMTNVRLGLSGYRCPRAMAMHQALAKKGEAPYETAVAALDAAHQHGPQAFTTYSTIYDLAARKVYLYHLANFSQAAEFDLMEELERRPRGVHRMKRLFKDGRTVKEMSAMPQRTEWDTRIELDEETLQRYAGEYSPAPDIIVRIESNGNGGLTVYNPGQDPATLFPETDTVFRIAPDRGLVTFHVFDPPNVEGFTLHKQANIFAKRLVPEARPSEKSPRPH